MKKSDKILPVNEAIALLKECTFGVLSTASADGVPYGVPVNYIYSEEENSIFFHGAKFGRKLANVSENNGASFVIVGYYEISSDQFTAYYKSVIVSGKMSLVTDAGEKIKRLAQLCKKMKPQTLGRMGEVIQRLLPAVAVLEMKIDNISGKRNLKN
ncbi:pyridoxamine 5'-phosphate oxidase family protein [Desulfosporosinus sp. BG]|uniref:pyridoxamine 5'-phosphate oxidase family protein n=1 Tax=Desulfosporosinus sp. BG TaxID=1633135 RepID=UPI00083B27E3|nr:pyridoxamine 5'-phosphate oxidase family protein [Desulfosporosinus sp. BG]ODA41884.1 Pyridoxamine 5'-phosphate oxidase-related, FMN-binding [Desulfosporosinus sp. BG]